MNRFAFIAWSCLFAALLALPAIAQDAAPADQSDQADRADQSQPASEPLAGHSLHGEAFNEGPRQAAYLMQGTGRVHFPVTTANADARRFIEQGVGQLHGFWYFEAERSFRQAAALDPDCAIAYWGMAMANVNNEKRARAFIDEADKRKKQASDRERLFIAALHAYYHAPEEKHKTRGHDYAKALERLIYKFPDDIEAKAWLALQLWKNATKDEPIRSHLAVDALLEEVFAVEPNHPAHHYRIHLWDREKADKALASAAACGPAAPGIAHMWHMPGHIYSKLHRYADAAWQQEASARVDHAHMMRDRVMPDQIHNFAHNNEWLIRNLNHLGRVRDAVDLARNMIELPRHPDYNVLSKRGSASLGRQRLFETLDRYELDDQLIALCDTPYLAPTNLRAEQARRLLYLGRAAFRQGDADALANHRDELKKLAKAKPAAKQNDDDKTGDSEEDAEKKETGKGPDAETKTIQRYVDELTAYQSALAGDFDAALAALKKVKPLDPMHLARVQAMAGRHDDAAKTLRNHIRANPNEVQPLAQLIAILHTAGKADEARKAFDDLRKIAAHADLNTPAPPLARLAPIAADLNIEPLASRTPTPAPDLGPRPPLDTLGPFRWQPSPAPDFQLQNAAGQTRTLSDFRGRPTILIFYLGQGCLHCTEQLQAFAPRATDFRDAGIDLLAISTDALPKLRESLQTYGESFPIPLLSDATLDTFRAFRGFDDFENQPLHATILLDPAGRIRWQDISHQPFMNIDFLLKESQRLLAQDAVAAPARAHAE